MITTSLQDLLMGARQGLHLRVDCLSNALLASPSWLALVRLFVLEVDDVGVVNVSDVTYADPPTKLTVKAKSKVLMAIPLLQIDGKGEVSKMKISHLF